MIRQYFRKLSNLDFLLLLFLFSIFLYTTLRAFNLSITHDEAISIIYHAQAGVSDIFQYSGSILANNHLLNTLLIKFSINIFGFSEFAARLPALIGAFFYLIGIFALVKYLFPLGLFFQAIFIIVFSVNPFVLDFLSLARGYSLALAFFIWGLVYWLHWLNEGCEIKKRKLLLYTSLLLSFSVFSNLAFLNLYLAFLAVTLIFVLRAKAMSGLVFFKYLSSVYFYPILPFTLFLFSIYFQPIKRMIEAKELYFGGNTSFLADTIHSLVEFSFYNIEYLHINVSSMIQILSIAIILFFALFSYVVCIKKKRIKDNYLLIILFVLFSWFSVESQFFLFGTKYIIGRAALFFIPLFYLLFAIFIKIYTENSLKYKSFIEFGSIFVCLLLFVHLLFSLNFYSVYSWKYDAKSKNVMSEIQELIKDGYDIKTIGASQEFWPSLNFYKLKYKISDLGLVNRFGPDGQYDAYYVTSRDIPIIKKYKTRLIKNYNLSDTSLFLGMLK